MLGNKGGVVTAFELDHTSLCFVNTHLAAHQGFTLERNNNIRSIFKSCKVGKHYLSSKGSGVTAGKSGVCMDIMSQFDHVIWLGDLNYRLDFGNQGNAKTPSADVHCSMVELARTQKGREFLFQHDQLLQERRSLRTLASFQEGNVTRFRPTFKVMRNIELETYLAQRSPAYCDRILWHSMDAERGTEIQLTRYDSAPSVITSDHKPVFATFELKTRVMEPALAQSITVRPTPSASSLSSHTADAPRPLLSPLSSLPPLHVNLQGWNCFLVLSDFQANQLVSVEERTETLRKQKEKKQSTLSRTLNLVKNTVQTSLKRSDPFIRISAPFLLDHRPIQLPPRTSTLNPRWPGQMADVKVRTAIDSIVLY